MSEQQLHEEHRQLQRVADRSLKTSIVIAVGLLGGSFTFWAWAAGEHGKLSATDTEHAKALTAVQTTQADMREVLRALQSSVEQNTVTNAQAQTTQEMLTNAVERLVERVDKLDDRLRNQEVQRRRENAVFSEQ